MTIDDLDLQIIGALQRDGRRSVVDIARELKVPKSTVQRRLDTLMRDEVIRVAAYADSSKLGLGIHVHLNLLVDLAYFEHVLAELGELIEVRWIAVTTGPSDIVAEAYFASPDHLHEFIRKRISAIKGITRLDTSVILSVEKLSFHWDALLQEAAHHALPHIKSGIGRSVSPNGSVSEPVAQGESVRDSDSGKEGAD